MMATLTYTGSIIASYATLPERAARAIATDFEQSAAPKLAEAVKANHPWVNQTGRLESSIVGYVNQDAGPATVTVGVGYDATALSDAGFPYGAHLEEDYGGSYAILRPTMIGATADILTAAKRIAGGK